MSATLAPSRSTVYISNLPFSLTNNDLHQILKAHGKIVRVTIVKDRHSRKSKGIAFVLFLDRNEARACANALDNSQLFGRTVKASIAKDNGRAAEFIRRREYVDKSRCYECGEFGHLSYECSRNALGEREPPPKKKKVRRKPEQGDSNAVKTHSNTDRHKQNNEDNDGDSDEYEGGEVMDSWSSVVNFQANLASVATSKETASTSKRKIVRQATYFSDEEELQEEEG